MKKQWIATMVMTTALFTLTACGGDVNDRFAQRDNLYNVGENTDQYNKNHNDDQFGFVRQVKSPVDKPYRSKSNQMINREDIANRIGNMTVVIPNVVDSSVLVTDQEVLVAYQISNRDKNTRFETADQVKKTAMSAVPRWYNIYVTDDPALRQNVENIASLNAFSKNKDKTVKDTVRLMLERSPQGRTMNEGENANGESIGGTNEDIKRTNYREKSNLKKIEMTTGLGLRKKKTKPHMANSSSFYLISN